LAYRLKYKTLRLNSAGSTMEPTLFDALNYMGIVRFSASGSFKGVRKSVAGALYSQGPLHI